MYCLRSSSLGQARVRLLGSGTILREALAAADILESEYGVGADVFSVTSYTELRRTAMEGARASRLGAPRTVSWIEQQLPASGTPVVAGSDYVSAVADLIRPWVRDAYTALGTDGFGRSDTRAALRAFFEVDRRSMALAALDAVDPELARVARAESATVVTPPPWSR